MSINLPQPTTTDGNSAPHYSREKWLLIILWAIALLLPILRWLSHTGNLLDYIVYNAPSGQIPYLLSKLMALLALSMLVMQFVLMALHFMNKLSTWTIRHHARLGIGMLLFTLAHVILFVTAKSLREGHLDLTPLVPDFNHGFYKSVLSMGGLALLGLFITVFAGAYRFYFRHNKISALVHKISFLLVVLIAYHCFSVGSEL